MRSYSTIKRDRLLKYEIIWMDLKYVMLSDKRQIKKSVYCISPFIGCSRKGQSIRTENRSVVAKEWTKDLEEFFDVMELFHILIVVNTCKTVY